MRKIVKLSREDIDLIERAIYKYKATNPICENWIYRLLDMETVHKDLWISHTLLWQQIRKWRISEWKLKEIKKTFQEKGLNKGIIVNIKKV